MSSELKQPIPAVSEEQAKSLPAATASTPKSFLPKELAIDSASMRTAGFVVVAIELAVAVYILSRFKLESDAFRVIARLVLGGFLVHHFLPVKLKMPLFLALSIASIAYVFGIERGEWVLATGLSRTAWLLGLGSALVGICHLPLPFAGRAGVLALAGAVLAIFRKGLVPVQVEALGAVWPILGAMFMFRIMVYLYDLEHEKERPQLIRSLSYFFLLPNICFPLFPVIDYKTFARNYFNDEPLLIYQKGLAWIFRGIVQLVLWRLVYYHYYLQPGEVASGTDIVRFMVFNFLLYLRVSGQFHLVIGLLHLFGFNLPETNRRYALASSFTDYWRRVNIYWKDFIMKLFYYPASFRLKSWGPKQSIVWATVYAFIVTWALHSYQWFWLRGDFPIIPQDLLFWGILGALVVANSLWELSHGRKRTLGKRAFTGKDAASLGGRTAATFLLLITLWSIWNCDSIEQWLEMWKLADAGTLVWGTATLAIVFVLAIAIEGPWGQSAPAAPKLKRADASAMFPLRRTVLACVVPAAILYVLSSGRVIAGSGPVVAPFLASLSMTQLNLGEQQQLERGYYEDLMDVSRFNSQLNEAYAGKPPEFKRLDQTDAVRPTSDFRWQELVPSKRTEVNGETITTNQWGMRDKEYTREKPPGTYRIALIGSSHVMGWGVGDGQNFESLVEARLNQELAGKPWARYEILDFGVNGYSPICQQGVLDARVFDFNPDAVYFVAHSNDPYWAMQRFAKSHRLGVPPPYPFLQELAKEADIGPKTPERWAQRRLNPHWPDMIAWAYQRIADQARAHGAQPVLLFLPAAVSEHDRSKDVERLLEFGKKAGFVELDLGAVFKDSDPKDVAVAAWDAHPNAKGHKIIADALFEALKNQGDLTIFKSQGAN
jgi:alginate O-acetyltransferase complex protein AlgI